LCKRCTCAYGTGKRRTRNLIQRRHYILWAQVHQPLAHLAISSRSFLARLKRTGGHHYLNNFAAIALKGVAALSRSGGFHARAIRQAKHACKRAQGNGKTYA
jgi:hypothetical protein